MGEQDSAGLQQGESKRDIFEVAATFERRGDYGTLILDRLGRIISCGTPVERLFGANRIRLAGHLISDFVAGLLPCGNSPSFNARYLVYLCADGRWRKYEATDAAGDMFAVELNLTRMATADSDRELFLLNVRRPEPADRTLAARPG